LIGLRGRNYKLLLAGQGISNFAATFGTFVISWLVYDLTGSKLAMGALWMVSICSQIIVQLGMSPYLDHWARKKVMMGSEWIRLIAYVGILLLSLQNQLSVEILYFTAFLTSIVMYDPAANALLPSVVKDDELVKANAKISGIVQMMRMVALPAAGFLIGFLGRVESLIVIAILFLISIMLIKRIEENGFVPSKIESWWKQCKKGIKFYKEQSILVMLGFFIAVTNFGIFATLSMYIPYVTEILGGSSFEYGLFAASFPLGYVIGTILVSRIKEQKKHKFTVMLGAIFIGGISYLLLGVTTLFWIAILIEIMAGVVMPFWNVHSTTLYQRVVPNEMRAQVFSVRFIISKAAAPLGILYGTFCATYFSISVLFLSVGLLTCTVAAIGMISLQRSLGKRQDFEGVINDL
jgi:MFS family permease